MIRYGQVTNKNKREIVLLKSSPCIWGKCTFCDYISDNSRDAKSNDIINKKILNKVSGKYHSLEVINSGSCFELSKETLNEIKQTSNSKDIHKLFFESHYLYRNRLVEFKEFFDIPITFKCGIETFDDNFRNNYLNKGAYFENVDEVSKYFESICLLIGIKGQTKEMIDKDIDILLKYFKYGCINIFTENSTNLKKDDELIAWFKEKYYFLNALDNIEILCENTDFGVGGTNDEE